MAGDDKQPAKNFASNGIILAVLIATGTAVYNHRAPLEGARPPVTDQPAKLEPARDDPEARLWQDPFGAVLKQYQDEIAKAADGQPDAEAPCTSVHCQSPLASVNGKTLVLAVTVQGSSFSDIVEARRRARYAVVSALGIAGFKPETEDHIHYYRPQACPATYEQPVAPEASSHRGNNAASLAKRKTKQKTALNSGRSESSDASGANSKSKPCLPKTSPWPHQVIPYEWFESADPFRVLVLWIKEDAFGKQPLRSLASLLPLLCPETSGNDCKANATLNIVGPSASTTLEAMLKEVSTADCPAFGGLNNGITFYAFSPTADNKALMPSYLSQNSVHQYLSAKCPHLKFFRTIATDGVLAKALVGELRKRNVDPLSVMDHPQQHVALISEWDTPYGRFFPNSMMRAFLPQWTAKASPMPWLHKFSYLRGLDGQAAAEPGSKKDSKTDSSSSKPSGILDLVKAQTNPNDDARASDRPDGQGQFDYLRRIADDLTALNEDLRAKGEAGIRAIGVVGSDVYDSCLFSVRCGRSFRMLCFSQPILTPC